MTVAKSKFLPTIMVCGIVAQRVGRQRQDRGRRFVSQSKHGGLRNDSGQLVHTRLFLLPNSIVCSLSHDALRLGR